MVSQAVYESTKEEKLVKCNGIVTAGGGLPDTCGRCDCSASAANGLRTGAANSQGLEGILKLRPFAAHINELTVQVSF